MTTTTRYLVDGMTCDHCVRAVTEEVARIDGVTDVAIDLAPGATSTVRVSSDAPIAAAEIESALDEAGDYTLAGIGA